MVKMRVPGSYPMKKSKIRLTLALKRYTKQKQTYVYLMDCWIYAGKLNHHASLYQQLTSFTLPVKEDYECIQKLGEMEQGVDDHEEGELNSQPGLVTPEEQTYEACT